MSAATTAHTEHIAQSSPAKITESIRVPRLVWLDGEPFEMEGDREVRGIHLLASQKARA